MSLLSKPATPIAPESARLLREARRARRQGFSKVAEELAMQGLAQKLKEPNIWRDGQRQAMADLKEGLAQAEINKAREAASQQVAGRKAFADDIKDKAKRGDEDTYDWASQESGKYGVNAGQLANFFDRNNLSRKRTHNKFDPRMADWRKFMDEYNAQRQGDTQKINL